MISGRHCCRTGPSIGVARLSTVGHLENGAAGRSITANPTALSRKSEFNQWSLQSAPRQLVHCAFLSRRLPSLPRAGQVPINNNNNNWLRRPANPYNWNGPAGSVPSGALQNRASLPVIAVTCKLIATLLLLASHFAFFSAFAFQFSCQARSLARCWLKLSQPEVEPVRWFRAPGRICRPLGLARRSKFDCSGKSNERQ